MDYGERMREIREINELNQKDIGKILGLSNYTYSHYETQDKIIPLKHLLEFCDYFNVSLDYIFNFNNTIKYPNQKKSDIPIYLNRLKEIRGELNLSQKELAKRLNIARSAIAEYEKGTYLIPTPILYELCKKFKISADYLLGRNDKPIH